MQLQAVSDSVQPTWHSIALAAAAAVRTCDSCQCLPAMRMLACLAIVAGPLPVADPAASVCGTSNPSWKRALCI